MTTLHTSWTRGAMDHSFVPIAVKNLNRAGASTRENVMAGVDFEMNFCYVLPGWAQLMAEQGR
jgi:hypothetical protein